MTGEGRKRVRRTVEASRQTILEAAERYLIDEGPQGVKVQRIARDLNLTDAAIHYHFGNREGLLDALLRFAGRRFVEDFAAATQGAEASSFDLGAAARLLSDLYDRRGAARLAMWLTLSGWSPPGEGMLAPLADHFHAARLKRAQAEGEPAPSLEDSRKLIALLSAVAFTQALAGDAMMRSVALTSVAPEAYLTWVVELIEGRAPERHQT